MNALAAGGVKESTLAMLLLGIGVVLVAGALLGRLAQRFRQPVVVGEITAGILLGPSALGLLPGDLSERLFPAEVRPLLSAVAQVGLVLFMFVVGWEFEKRLVRPHAGLAAGVSMSSIVLSFGLGVALAPVLYDEHATVAGKEISFVAFATFLGTAMSVTAFPVLARVLTENRLLGTRIGSLSLASAAVDDLLAWCLLAYVSALVSSDGDYTQLGRIALLSVGYVALMFLVVRPLAARLVWRWAAAERWPMLLAVLSSRRARIGGADHLDRHPRDLRGVPLRLRDAARARPGADRAPAQADEQRQHRPAAGLLHRHRPRRGPRRADRLGLHRARPDHRGGLRGQADRRHRAVLGWPASPGGTPWTSASS